LHSRKFFLLAHPDCISSWSVRNPLGCLPNSGYALYSGAASKCSYLSLSIVRSARSCCDDLFSHPHALFSAIVPSGGRPTFAPPTTNTFAPPTTNTFAPPTTNTFAPPTTNTFAPPTTNTFAPPTTNTFASTIIHAFVPAITNASAPTTSNASSSDALVCFAPLPDSPSDAVALSLCPICDIASTNSCFDCEQQFCARHVYSCADCGNHYCGDCLDAHHADGHWADSDTVAELAASRGVIHASSVNPLHLLTSEVAHESHCAAPERHGASLLPHMRTTRMRFSFSPGNAANNQRRPASWPAITAKFTSPFSRLLQRLTPLATLLRPVFQSVALQSEVGL
jgi:hypothetical protein